jgi:hypothetical protein
MLSMLHLLAQTYDYTTTTTHTSDKVGAGLALAFMIPLLIFLMAFAVLAIVGMWKTFEKAGKPGWASIVPFYNYWVLAEIAGKPGWWGLVGLGSIVPFVGFFAGMAWFILLVLICVDLVKRFGKDSAFAVLLVLLPAIGFMILGFGDAKYTTVPPVMADPPLPPIEPTVTQ